MKSLSDSEAKMNSPVQLLTVTVDTLASVTEDEFLASLTQDDYQRVVASLDKLIDIVDENENHFLTPFMDFISNLIVKCEEEFNMEEEPTRDEAAYDDESEYTLDMLIAINPDYEDASKEWDSAATAQGIQDKIGNFLTGFSRRSVGVR